MKYASFLFFFSFLFLTQIACQKDNEVNGGEWLVPSAEVRDGGVGKDGIPAISSPAFVSATNASFMTDDEIVLVIKVGDDVRAYPHMVLDWHEIVNDKVGDLNVAITYCPLTGTGVGWNRELSGKVTTFGVSGLLYNSNLIPYDRETNSNWSQMRLQCVNGNLLSTTIETYPLVEMNWKTCKEMFPDVLVESIATGHDRDYGRYPYGDYKTSAALLSSINPRDTRMHPKERVMGLTLGGKVKVYPFSAFTTDTLDVIEDEFEGEQVVLFGSEEQNYIVAYKRTLSDGTVLNFETRRDLNTPNVVALDEEGNSWNIFGEAIAGPRVGQQLEATVSYMGYWFGWGAFYPKPLIHE